MVNAQEYVNQKYPKEERKNITEITIGDDWEGSLDLSDFINLEKVQSEWSCPKGELTGINVSNCSKLIELDIFNKKLTSLDLSKNRELRTLRCGRNSLTNLNVSNNPNLEALICFDNELSKLDLSKNRELGRLLCHENKLTSLDLSNTKIKESDWTEPDGHPKGKIIYTDLPKDKITFAKNEESRQEEIQEVKECSCEIEIPTKK